MARSSPAARPPSAGPALPVREPQLATLVACPPEGDAWVHEQKFDGYRILAVRRAGAVTLLSRRAKDWTGELPAVAAAIAAMPGGDLVLDGEVAVVMADGRTRFQALQHAFAGEAAGLTYFAFDLLVEGAADVTAWPLEERKARLAALLAAPGVPPLVRYSDHVIGQGAALFALACARGLEGIVSKRRDAPYTSGRGKAWLKTKCLLRQELVIGGYTEPAGARRGLGALLLGYHEAGRLVYAGKVGTGFTQRTLDELSRALADLAQARCPFTPAPPRASIGPRARWVRPTLVAEIAFSEWTDDGRLRHPSFQGLRRDKPARDVVRERPAVSGAA